MASAETKILNRVWKRASVLGYRLFRNNVGLFRRLTTDDLVRCGLCPGSADLIGWRTIQITPEMVGTHIAQFVAVEIKTPQGRISQQQRAWLETVQQAGGVALVARSEDDISA